LELKEYELGQLLTYEQPTAYIVKSTEYNYNYKTPVLTAGKSFILGYTNEKENIFDKLPVIIFDDFTTAAQYVNFEFKVKSSAMKILHINTELVNPKYIYYRMQIIQFDHSTHKRYWIQQYSKLKVQIPPLVEQERIVAKIEELFSELDNAVETLNATKAKLEVYRQAVLLKAFEPKNNWNIGKLGDVIQVLTDYHANGSYEILKQHVELLDTPDYALMIRSTNFEKNDFSNDLKYITKEAYDFLKKSQLFGDEVLMGKIGNAGKVYYMKDLNRPMSLAMNLFAMRFDRCVSSKYVYYFLNSAKSIEDIKKHVKGVGTPTINKNSVRDLYFAYPDTNEQKNIVTEVETKLSLYDSVNLTLDNILRQASAMRQSILKQAFEGRLL
jgi:type I restriction enzyme, S subunit